MNILFSASGRTQRLTRSFFLAGVGALGLIAPSVALAQAADAASVSTDGIQDIVVTAQKRSEATNRVPISISAFTGETLERLRVRDTNDLTAAVPGFTATVSPNNTPIYTIRGIGFNAQAMSYTSPVGVYVDEVSYAYPYMTSLVAFDLQRVEVLKGPQGSLYGRNTTGGAVNFVPQMPTQNFDAEFTLNAGNFESYGVEGHISGPVSSTVAARVAFRVDRSDQGWQHSVSRPGDTLGKKRQYAARTTLQWEPTSSFNAVLSGTFWHNRSDTPALQAIRYKPLNPGFEPPNYLASIVPNPTRGNIADWAAPDHPGAPFNATAGRGERYKGNAKFAGVSLRMTGQLNDNLSLTSLTGYNYLKSRDVNSIGGAALTLADQISFGHIGSFNQEVRLAGTSDKLSFIVGGYYSNDKISDTHDTKSADQTNFRFLRTIAPVFGGNAYTPEEYALVGAIYRAPTKTTFRTGAIFGNLTYEIIDGLKLTGAARYTQERGRSTACLQDIDGLDVPLWKTVIATLVGLDPGFVPNGCLQYNNNRTSTGPVHNRIHDDTVSWRANIDWSPSPDTLVYANISRGYKSGVFPVAPGVYDTTLRPVGKEKVTSYEAGLKAKLLDRRVQLNLAGFYNDYRDKQIKAYVPDPIFGVVVSLGNVPKSETYGLDMQLDWQVSPNLLLTSGLLYLKTKITEYQGFDASAQPVNFAGLALPFAPKWSLNGGATYTQPVGEDLSIEATGTVSYRSKTTGQPSKDPLFRLRSYALADAIVSLVRKDSWKASLWGKNLFNKYYWTNADDAGETIVRTPGMVRTYGVSLTFQIH